MATARAMLERRRSSRVPIRIPVTIVRSETTNNDTRETPAEVVSVSRYGALLRLPFRPPVGSRLEILHGLSREVREFRVISVKDQKVPGAFELGVEIFHPAQNFWGVQFPDERHPA